MILAPLLFIAVTLGILSLGRWLPQADRRRRVRRFHRTGAYAARRFPTRNRERGGEGVITERI